MNEKCLFFWALCSVICFVFSPRDLFSSEPQEFLDEDVDFDAVYSELPSDFNISTASVFSLIKLPYFSLESAQLVIAARDSLFPGQLVALSDALPGLSPMERAVLDYMLSLPGNRGVSSHTMPSETKEHVPLRWGKLPFKGYVRQGIVHDRSSLDREKVADSRYYAKLYAKSQGMTVSLIGERDRFEPRALDLVSGSGEYKLDRGRMTVIVGDYRPGFGQGVLFSRYGRAYGNGADIMQRKPATTINTSWEETRFLRGAFLSLRRNRVTTETWFSRRTLDATLDDDGHAVTIRDSGYHYSGQVRGNLTETVNGARCEFEPSGDIALAVTGVVSNYSPELARKEDESSYHDPEGSTFRYISLDGSFYRGPAVFFFEHAVMNRAETGTIAGVEFSKPALRGCIAARRYSEGFWSYHAGGFSAFGNTSNEQGVYSAVQADLPGNMNLSASMDLARMLYRTKTALLPRSRRRLNVVLIAPPIREFVTWIGFRSVDDTDTGLQRRNASVSCEKRLAGYSAHSMLLRSKFAWSTADGSGGPYLETSLRLDLDRFRCTFAGGLFDLPSYDTRFYRYEYDVPGRGYARPVWGRGGTMIAILQWNPLSLRYRWSDSDLMETSHEVTIQLDASF